MYCSPCIVSPVGLFRSQAVESRCRKDDDSAPVRVSTLTLVDLAGSERIGKTGELPYTTSAYTKGPFRRICPLALGASSLPAY